MAPKKIFFTTLLGFLISAISLYYSFQNIPVEELTSAVKSVQYAWIIPAVAFVVLGFTFRALRWQILLRSTMKISFTQACHPLFIGFMLNCALPARLGEIARPIILRTRTGIDFSAGIGSVVIERFLDLVFTIICFTVVVNLVNIDPDLNLTFAGGTLNRGILIAISRKLSIACAGIAFFILLISFKRTRTFILDLLSKAPEKIRTPLLRYFNSLAAVVTALSRPRVLLMSVITTLTIWMLHAMAYYVMTLAFNGVNLSLTETFFYMIIICFFITLPSVPGYWGLWEAGGIFSLLLLGVPEQAGAAFTLVNHAIQLLPVILLGIISLLVTGIRIGEIRSFE